MHNLEHTKKDVFNLFEELLKYCETNNDLNCESEIKEFLSCFKKEWPIIKGEDVLFLYFGPATLVNVVGDYNNWDSFDETSKLERVSNNTNLFYVRKKFALDARLDYLFVVDTDWILDPLNNKKLLGGFGYNSELHMPNYLGSSAKNSQDLVHGGSTQVVYFNSKVQKNWKRKITIYTPAGYDSEEACHDIFPSLYVIDGTDYLTAGNAIETLDKIILSKQIPPIIVIFIDPLSPSLRIRDFNGKDCQKKSDLEKYKGSDICKKKYCEFLIEELVPYVDSHYRIDPSSKKRAHVGVSLGGILSTYVASEFSDYFRLIGSQSGAFWIDTSVYEHFANFDHITGMRFYLNAGTFEQRNCKHTKLFAKILKEKGYTLKEVYLNQGHSWGQWRETFSDMLEFLFKDYPP